MLKRNIVITLLILLCLTGCKEKSNVTVVSNNTTEATPKELVSEEEFLEYYGLTREDIGDFDLQAMIVHYGISEEILLEDRDFCLNELNESIETGKDFNCYASDYIRQEYKRMATKQDDLKQTKYILLSFDIRGQGCLCSPRQILIDVKNKKSYYSDGMNVWDNFSYAEVIKSLDEDQIEGILSSLEDKKIYKWERGNGVMGDGPGDYSWNLYLVMGRGDVIAYSGGSLGNNKKFVSWYNELLEIVK